MDPTYLSLFFIFYLLPHFSLHQLITIALIDIWVIMKLIVVRIIILPYTWWSKWWWSLRFNDWTNFEKLNLVVKPLIDFPNFYDYVWASFIACHVTRFYLEQRTFSHYSNYLYSFSSHKIKIFAGNFMCFLIHLLSSRKD